MQKLVCLDDIELAARQRLSKQIYDYYRSGADDEVTLSRARKIFKRYILRPSVLVDVSVRDLSVGLLNESCRVPMPIAIASTATQCLAHPDGEKATARAAASTGTLMICSTIATTSLEDIATAAPDGLRWFQLYVCKDRNLTKNMVQRAELAGYKALVVTVDTPISGKRRDDVRNGYTIPPHLRMANFDADPAVSKLVHEIKPGQSAFARIAEMVFDDSLSWKDIVWLQGITKLPILLKGILTAEDAMKAVAIGVSGIIVSNHGARQLDTCPTTLEALPEIVDSVKGRCEVYLDGGVRTGTDVFKALALGAKTVFVGRPILWGLAVGGCEGVRQVLEILREEFDTTMALMGCRKLSDITKDMIVPKSYYKKNFEAKL